jgi:hexosaminidase
MFNFFLVSLFITSMCFNDTYAQSAAHLSYEWKIERKGSETKTIFVLTNLSKSALRGTDWEIYFNSIKVPKLTASAASMYEVKQINGDLHCLSATKNFRALQSNKTHSIQFLIPGIRNYTELPSGFYFVHNQQPASAYPLKNKRKEDSYIELSVSKASFIKNEKIEDLPKEKLVKIFPSPLQYEEKNGSFEINSKTHLQSDDDFTGEAHLLQKDLAKLLAKAPPTQFATGHADNVIILRKQASLGKSYTLQVTENNIVICSGEAAGIFYGIQSLKTLIDPDFYASKQKAIKVKAVDVLDAPRFNHRALLVDVARNFLPKSELLKTIDLMGLYKLNILHLHLIDDEGWRLEIPGLPELTEVGAKRGHSVHKNLMLPPSYGSGPNVANGTGSGFYSVADFKEILQYATARHIKVIPEIETPGHARAAIKSMVARYDKYVEKGDADKAKEYLLADPADKSIYRSVQGWNDNVINMGMPSTYRFLEKVIDEIIHVYQSAGAPLETIHMGGDEVPSGVWMGSPVIRNLMEKDTTLKNVADLWRYYFKRTNQILQARKLYLYGWEEVDLKQVIQDGKKKLLVDAALVDENYQVDVWNNIIGTGSEDLAYRLANTGFRVVLSNVTNMYLDMAYNNSFYEHGMNWAGYVDADKPFGFIPYNYYKSITEDEYGNPVSPDRFTGKHRLQDSARKQIAGLQSALWSETLTDTLKFEYLLLPKLLGFAERAWAKDPAWASLPGVSTENEMYQKAWSVFANVSGKRELPRLNYYANGFAYRIPEPGVAQKNGLIEANVQLPGMTIRYTADGSLPNIHSTIYRSPVREKGTVTLRVFNQKGAFGKAVRIINK